MVPLGAPPPHSSRGAGGGEKLREKEEGRSQGNGGGRRRGKRGGKKGWETERGKKDATRRAATVKDETRGEESKNKDGNERTKRV